LFPGPPDPQLDLFPQDGLVRQNGRQGILVNISQRSFLIIHPLVTAEHPAIGGENKAPEIAPFLMEWVAQIDFRLQDHLDFLPQLFEIHLPLLIPKPEIKQFY
jgi:hypothetical protein